MIENITEVENYNEWNTRKTEEKRRKEYADPVTGSDPLFAQYNRMVAMTEPGADIVLQSAIERYKEIKKSLPWPNPE